jgi:tRNA (mo5U34)-methyltransferase
VTLPSASRSAERSVEDLSLAERIRALGPWFHNLRLDGIETAPEHFLGDHPRQKWVAFQHLVPEDLTGMSVLDIGCNAGFYSIELKRRGASRVVGIDSDRDYLAQARFAAEVSGVDLEFRKLSVYDVGTLRERFDIVLFLGVFYHLRHPLLALDLIHEHVARDLLVFQSMQRGSPEIEALEEDYPFGEVELFDRPGFPRMHFIERRYCGDQTNWWVPNRACSEALLRSARFEILDRPEEEVFICRRREMPGESHAVYPRTGEER